MTVKDITERLAPMAKIILHDRASEDGTVYSGTVMNMRTIWDAREVSWIRAYDHELVIEVE